MDAVWLIVAIILLLLWVSSNKTSKTENFPPGPPCLPVWGSYWTALLCNYKYLHKGLAKLQRWYKTNAMSMYLGAYPCVVVNEYSGIKEVLTRREFDGRVLSFLTKLRSFGKVLGIILNDGKNWEEQRRFLLRNMRDFGYARRFQKQEDIYAQEVQDLIDLLNGKRIDVCGVIKGDCALFPSILYPTAVNSLWAMLTGSTLPASEYPKLYAMGKSVFKFTGSIDSSGSAITFFPWLKHVSSKLFGYEAFAKGNDGIFDFVKEHLSQHLKDYSEDDSRGFIDIYKHELLKQAPNDKETSFTEEQMHMVVTDMLVPTYNALCMNLAYGILCLCHYPSVMHKIQKELDDVVGRGRLPTLNDRSSLHYTEAVYRETLRRYSGAALGVLRRSTEDTQLQGYSIPKDTVLMTNLYQHHMSKEVWGDPEVFRPERFLDEEGKLMKKDITFPFGGGRRVCVGETFSRHMLFLVLASLVQNFNFSMPDSKSFPNINTRISGLVLLLPEFWVKFTPRN